MAMDFNYSPEQEAYRMQVRTWLEANQPPPLTPGGKGAHQRRPVVGAQQTLA